MSKTLTLVRSKYSSRIIELLDGQKTTVKYLEFDKKSVSVELVCFDELTRLEDYCQKNEVDYAINGGFFGTEFNSADTGAQLGELWVDGQQISESSSKFDRGCVFVDKNGGIRIDRRSTFSDEPVGSILEVGPLLVKGGKVLIKDGYDPEGFSTESSFFDGDLTKGRFPRSALAISREKVWAIICEGRSDDSAGMTLKELTEYALSLGAVSAINLDGGSASSLIVNQGLINKPRMSDDRGNQSFPHGRPIKTAIIFR